MVWKAGRRGALGEDHLGFVQSSMRHAGGFGDFLMGMDRFKHRSSQCW
jgi:hypothetical protein